MIDYDALISKTRDKKFKKLKQTKEPSIIKCNWTGNCNGLLDTTNEIYDAMVIPFLHLEDALPNIKTFMGALKALKSIDNILPILKEWDIVNVGPCLNRNTCELNPTPSRYKKQLETERQEAIEKEELRRIEYLNELVICNKKHCKLYGNVETCQHGIVHKWTENCRMECPRYPMARCIPVGGV